MKPTIPSNRPPTYPSEEIALRSKPKIVSRSFLKRISKILPRVAIHFTRKALWPINMLKARIQLTAGVKPLSRNGGHDRGKPLNRYYLEQFLQRYSSDIFGHCLEFRSDDYTSRFGGNKVNALQILHKEADNKRATIIADLTKPNDIPSNCFDCIICTYVLHLIFDFDKVVSELHRILKPQGVLLVAVPHVSMNFPQYHEFWRFTPEGLHLLLARVFETENVIVEAYGNSLTAAGSMRGLVAQDFTKAELDYHDPDFAVGVFARAWK